MSATAEDVLATLKSIDTQLGAIAKHLGIGAKPAASAQTTAPTIAPNSDMDCKWGDEKIKFNPRDWTGDSRVGLLMHECEPAFLDLLASACDFFAQKNAGVLTYKGQPKSMYDQRTASRARGWASRLRAGWMAPVEPEAFPSDAAAPLTDDEIPFLWIIGAIGLAHVVVSVLA